MGIERFSGSINEDTKTAVLDFRHEKDLYHLSPISVLGAYYMALGSEGLKTLPTYESSPGSVPIFYEAESVKVFRDTINQNTAAIVLGNMAVSLEGMLTHGKLDWEAFKERHNQLVKGTCMEGKISLAGVTKPPGRIKPGIEALKQKQKANPTLISLITSYYHLPYELEMVMQRNYTIVFDTGRVEQQLPIGSHVSVLMRDFFHPAALNLLENGLQYPIPHVFLDFLEGEEIREDVVAFLTGKK